MNAPTYDEWRTKLDEAHATLTVFFGDEGCTCKGCIANAKAAFEYIWQEGAMMAVDIW